MNVTHLFLLYLDTEARHIEIRKDRYEHIVCLAGGLMEMQIGHEKGIGKMKVLSQERIERTEERLCGLEHQRVHVRLISVGSLKKERG